MPLGKQVGVGPGHIVLDGDPMGTQPPTAAPSHFRPMSIVAKRSPISATAELLLTLPEQPLALPQVKCALCGWTEKRIDNEFHLHRSGTKFVASLH